MLGWSLLVGALHNKLDLVVLIDEWEMILGDSIQYLLVDVRVPGLPQCLLLVVMNAQLLHHDHIRLVALR